MHSVARQNTFGSEARSISLHRLGLRTCACIEDQQGTIKLWRTSGDVSFWFYLMFSGICAICNSVLIMLPLIQYHSGNQTLLWVQSAESPWYQGYSQGRDDRLEYAVSSMQGYRVSMEDAVSIDHPSCFQLFPRYNGKQYRATKFMVYCLSNFCEILKACLTFTFLISSMKPLWFGCFQPHHSLVFMMAMEVGIFNLIILWMESTIEFYDTNRCDIQLLTFI
jgi:hypothetical protein